MTTRYTVKGTWLTGNPLAESPEPLTYPQAQAEFARLQKCSAIATLTLTRHVTRDVVMRTWKQRGIEKGTR